MFNPFKAIGGAIAKAGRAVGKAIGGGLERTGGALSKAGGRMQGKAPAARPPAAAPAKERTRVMPTVTPPAAKPPEKKLPPSMVRGPSVIRGPQRHGGMAVDESILGIDSDQQRELTEAVKEFESEHSMADLNRTALNFLDQPSYAAIFDKYTTGSGFSTEQWIRGMSNVRNLRIARSGDGIKILFDADFEIDDYDLGGRSPVASF